MSGNNKLKGKVVRLEPTDHVTERSDTTKGGGGDYCLVRKHFEGNNTMVILKYWRA